MSAPPATGSTNTRGETGMHALPRDSVIIMDAILQRLAQLGLTLPAFNTRGGNYVQFTRHDNLVFAAGQVCLVDDVLKYQGTVGVEVTLEQAQDAARLCALNLIAIAHAAADGELDRVRVLKVNGYIKCLPEFTQQAKVLDGASNLFIELFGQERGGHARAAIGVTALPRGAPVEVEAVFAIDSTC
ncbi:TPA: RidA family protein [Pseudomonas putida]|uniref:RidA family protein n=1 Tax=Pseudomonas putida TaxID=303 RepID=UPI00110CF017|nr:RidA family protein [Pseudomonas putida]MDD1993573.1 RidA family protein [Pseudomonas putida]HDS0916520.1 RidA family protein [Pseudomonas putida]HDS0932155.1 RidA family protein [Pseudomonas putida]HDS1781562.1 RidA family protein [Pseudomonas putida]HDS3797158.1 RidA family protein [Pseudomonas putida]